MATDVRICWSSSSPLYRGGRIGSGSVSMLDVARTFVYAVPAIMPALVHEIPTRSRTSAETSGHALRRTTEDENWGGAQAGGPRIQGYPGGRSLSGRIFEGVSARQTQAGSDS